LAGYCEMKWFPFQTTGRAHFFIGPCIAGPQGILIYPWNVCPFTTAMCRSLFGGSGTTWSNLASWTLHNTLQVLPYLVQTGLAVFCTCPRDNFRPAASLLGEL